MEPLVLMTERLILRCPIKEDVHELKELNKRNQTYWQQWEPKQKEDEQTQLKQWILECQEERSARFFGFLKDKQDSIITICNFTQIFRGHFQACYLGYKIDQSYEGQGLMLEALTRLIHYVFNEMDLHRIMANHMPSNQRSAQLLKRLGFEVEGYAKQYLCINGTWEDHVLTALVNTCH